MICRILDGRNKKVMTFESRRGQNEKKTDFVICKNVFLFNFFLAGPLALHFKNDL
jgi:hypothetical protein